MGATDAAQAPIIVFNDADLDWAVNGVAFAAFIASGQTCVSGTRILVQSDVYDSFLTRFVDKVESITRRMGNRMWIDAPTPPIKSDNSSNGSDEPAINDGFCDITPPPGQDPQHGP